MNIHRPEPLLSRLLRPHRGVPYISRNRGITASLGNLVPLQPPALWNCFFLPDWKSPFHSIFPLPASLSMLALFSWGWPLSFLPAGWVPLFPYSCCSSQAVADATHHQHYSPSQTQTACVKKSSSAHPRILPYCQPHHPVAMLARTRWLKTTTHVPGPAITRLFSTVA